MITFLAPNISALETADHPFPAPAHFPGYLRLALHIAGYHPVPRCDPRVIAAAAHFGVGSRVMVVEREDGRWRGWVMRSDKAGSINIEEF